MSNRIDTDASGKTDWPQRFALAATIALALLAALIYANRLLISTRVHLYVDDAYIHMRYARHLAQGLGLVWNPGEAPVEGFTSFSYVLLLAGLERIGLAPVTVAAWLGLLCTIAVAALTLSLARLVNPQGRVENLLVVTLLMLTPPMVLWTFAGLESALFTALVTASALSYLLFRQGRLPAWLVSLIFLLATLTRPEAALLFGVTALLEGVARRRARQKIVDSSMLALVGPYLVLFSLFVAWRWSYFGYPLPNTYYAKTGGGFRQIVGGFDYLVSNLAYLLLGVVVVVGLVWLAVRSRPTWSYSSIYLALLLLSSWIGILLTGGDQFPEGRFIMPTLPLFFVLLSRVLTDILSDAELRAATRVMTTATLVIVTILFWRPTQWIMGNGGQGSSTEAIDLPVGWMTGYTLMGQALRIIASPCDSIAVVPVGAIGYFSNLTVIDMVGIVDPVIAHEPLDPLYAATWRPGHDKGNGTYVLSQRPTLIQLVDRLTQIPRPEPDNHTLQYKSVVEIWASEEFHRNYEFYPVQMPGGWYYNLYRRNDP